MNNTHIEAPFSEAEVESLKKWQNGPNHPFTCGTPEFCAHATRMGEHGKILARSGSTDLIPAVDGFICPCGQYKQNWCHNYMAGYDGDEVCQECGRGHVLAVGMTQPNGTQNYECDNCGNHQSFP